MFSQARNLPLTSTCISPILQPGVGQAVPLKWPALLSCTGRAEPARLGHLPKQSFAIHLQSWSLPGAGWGTGETYPVTCLALKLFGLPGLAGTTAANPISPKVGPHGQLIRSPGATPKWREMEQITDALIGTKAASYKDYRFQHALLCL